MSPDLTDAVLHASACARILVPNARVVAWGENRSNFTKHLHIASVQLTCQSIQDRQVVENKTLRRYQGLL